MCFNLVLYPYYFCNFFWLRLVQHPGLNDVLLDSRTNKWFVNRMSHQMGCVQCCVLIGGSCSLQVTAAFFVSEARRRDEEKSQKFEKEMCGGLAMSKTKSMRREGGMWCSNTISRYIVFTYTNSASLMGSLEYSLLRGWLYEGLIGPLTWIEIIPL